MRRWPGFRPGTEDGILPLQDVSAFVSTPRHIAKFDGKYVSSAPGYAPGFYERLRALTGGAAFWLPRPPP